MIRRIVDSMSLVIGDLPEGDAVCSHSLLGSSETNGMIIRGHAHPTSISGSTRSSTSSLSSPSRSSSICSSKRPLDVVDTIVSPAYQDKPLSISTSCYVPSRIQTRSLEKETSEPVFNERTSSPSPTRHFRRQSPSPGFPVTTTGRHAVGDLLRHQKRALPTQPTSSSFANSKSLNENAADNLGSTDESGAAADVQSDTGTSSQVDSLAIKVECLVLPFVRNLSEVELRIPISSLCKEQRRILKKLAFDNELFIMCAPKSPIEEPMLVLHKRAGLVHRQQVELERIRHEAEARSLMLAQQKEEQNLLESEAKQLVPAVRDTGCQAEEEQAPVGRKKYRRLRRERRRLANQLKAMKKPSKTHSSMQTVPEDYWLCPWCLEHIAPEKQCGHEPICRAGVKQQQKENELRARLVQRNTMAKEQRRLRAGLPPSSKNLAKQSDGKQLNGVVAVSRRTRDGNNLESRKLSARRKSHGRARSSGRTDSTALNTITTKLETVHPNDLSAMVHLMHRVCSEPLCQRIADTKTGDDASVVRSTGVKCQWCRRVYCQLHRAIGMHTACEKKTDEPTSAGGVSIACGVDGDEKKAALKAAIRERRNLLMERRQRL